MLILTKCCLIISFVIFVLVLVLIGHLLDKKKWNKGHCPKCNNDWKQFDVDSQGGIGFKCGCGNTIWLNGYIKSKRPKKTKKPKEFSKFQLMSLSK